MTNEKVEVVETVVLHGQIGDSLILVLFGIVQTRAAPVLLGASFINKFMKGILPSVGTIIRLTLPPVPILRVNKVKSDRTKEQKDDTVASTMAE